MERLGGCPVFRRNDPERENLMALAIISLGLIVCGILLMLIILDWIGREG